MFTVPQPIACFSPSVESGSDHCSSSASAGKTNRDPLIADWEIFTTSFNYSPKFYFHCWYLAIKLFVIDDPILWCTLHISSDGRV